MKVLIANNYYYLRGGCERVMFNDIHALAAQGIEIIPFAAADPENVETPYSSFFVPGADIRATNPLRRVEAAIDAIHCRRTVEAFGKMLDQDQAGHRALPQHIWASLDFHLGHGQKTQHTCCSDRS